MIKLMNLPLCLVDAILQIDDEIFNFHTCVHLNFLCFIFEQLIKEIAKIISKTVKNFLI